MFCINGGSMENTGSVKNITPHTTSMIKQPGMRTNFQALNPRATYQETMKEVDGVKKKHMPVIKKTGIMGKLEDIGKKLHIIA
jgi:hypothetical protein